MNDFARLENLSQSFQEKQKEYWRIGDREKPRSIIALFYVLMFSSVATAAFIFWKTASLTGAFMNICVLAQLLLLVVLSLRVVPYFRFMRRLNRVIIQTKDEIVSINSAHIQELLRQVLSKFSGENRDFAEFFCCMAAFFGFVSKKAPHVSAEKPQISFVDRWKIPDGTTLETFGRAVIDSQLVRSIPAQQRVGILTSIRKNTGKIAEMDSGAPAGDYDFEHSIYLVKHLSGKTFS